MTALARLGLMALIGVSVGCNRLDRFDTSDDDAAYCGSIVSAQFVRTTASEGGFQRELRARLTIDTDFLTSTPARLSTDDAADGPCSPRATFENAVLRATPEVVHDPLSTLMFGESQEHNILGWAESVCRGPMFAVVSLLKSNDVELRLLKPVDPADPVASAAPRSAFALFKLQRRQGDCGF